MSQNQFEQIKKFDKNGNEFWYARQLAKILNYNDFGNFENVIKKAKQACVNSGFKLKDHIGDVTEMVHLGSGSSRDFSSYKLSRYFCYLIAQSADPKKKEVALAHTYFATKTRQKEILEILPEDLNRIGIRQEVKVRNKELASAASKAGVRNFANFQDQGYIGLYGGLRQKQIKVKKGLQEKDNLLDNIGSEELGANLFRITQANAKIEREKITDESRAGAVHKRVGEDVRDFIKRAGNTMPENLPRAEHIKFLKKRVKENKKMLKPIKNQKSKSVKKLGN